MTDIAGAQFHSADQHAVDASSVGRLDRPSAWRSLTALRISADVFALTVSLAIAFILRFRFDVLLFRQAEFNLQAHVVASLLWVGGAIAGMASLRLYDEDTLVPGGREMSRVRRALIEDVALIAAAVFLLQFFAVSRGWFVLVAACSWGLISAGRLIVRAEVRHERARGRLRRSAVLVGSAPAPVKTSEEETSAGLDEFDFIAHIGPGELPQWLELARASSSPGRFLAPVVLIDESVGRDDFWHLAILAGEAGCPVFSRSPVRAVSPDRTTTRRLGGHTIVKIAPPALAGFRAFTKRSFDVAVSALLALVFAIPMLVIAGIVLVTSGRPVFYGQERIGRGGKSFRMWKFRTMRFDAEAETGPVWATTQAGDPRRTPAGQSLRRLSLDELPQFWNVLRGDMSLVGPRPERPVFVSEFSDGVPWYRDRLRMRPGITGLAQVQGLRGNTPIEPRVESDNRYIEQWSLLLDIDILIRTVEAVLRGRGAG